MPQSQYSHINNFIYFFINKLRLSSPWKFKVPFLISVPYFVFLLSNYNGLNSLKFILASIFIIIGVAAFGYLTNDLGDREKDKFANKNNATSKLSNTSIFILIIFFLALMILPWLYLKFNLCSIALLITQLFLFYAYAFKPFRLKEKGFFGIITDALYAHVLPSILASYTFFLILNFSIKKYFPFIILLSFWQLFLGIRNIIFHQLIDFENDISSQTHTFVTKIGVKKTEYLIKKIILPTEIAFFISFLIYVSLYYAMFLILVFMYWIYKRYSEKQKITTLNYRSFSYKYLDDLYIQWIPLCVLILLCINSSIYITILILHFILFRSEVKTYVINKIK